MSLPSRACAAALVAAALAGCQALGGGGGVMPETSVGLPPSMRGTAPGPQVGRTARADSGDYQPQSTPTRRLDLPGSAGGQTRAAANEERRIRREDLEGAGSSRANSGGLAPQMSQSGGVGLGGKF